MKLVLGYLGILVAAVGIGLAIAALVDLVGGGDGQTGADVLLGMVVFFGLTGAGGLYLAWTNLRRPVTPRPSDDDLERRVLGLAQRNDGRVTVAEVALEGELSVAESRSILERLSRQGVAETQITSGGDLVYAFAGFLSDDEKAGARDPLEA